MKSLKVINISLKDGFWLKRNLQSQWTSFKKLEENHLEALLGKILLFSDQLNVWNITHILCLNVVAPQDFSPRHKLGSNIILFPTDWLQEDSSHPVKISEVVWNSYARVITFLLYKCLVQTSNLHRPYPREVSIFPFFLPQKLCLKLFGNFKMYFKRGKKIYYIQLSRTSKWLRGFYSYFPD